MANLLKNILGQQQVRYLPRWVQRQARKVIEPDNYDSLTDNVQPQSKHDTFENNPISPASKTHESANHKTQSSTTTKAKFTDILKSTFDKDGNIIYSKMGNNDIRVSKIMAAVKSKRVKEKNKLMLLEGKTLIREALQSGCKLEYVLFSRSKEVEYLKPYLPKGNANLFKVPYTELQAWSDLVTTPGIMGVFQIPDLSSYKAIKPLPITIVCDNIREPNNLGAILRICSGAGCEQIILTKGCVDVWETKVLRSASGAHFKVNIVNKPNSSELSTILSKNCSVFIADNKLGNFGTGREGVTDIPVVPYFSVDFKLSQPIVLIIGGETEGISDTSYELAAKRKGVRLNIPLDNGLNSLNSGSALGIIVFEMKRQLIKLQPPQADRCTIESVNG